MITFYRLEKQYKSDWSVDSLVSREFFGLRRDKQMKTEEIELVSDFLSSNSIDFRYYGVAKKEKSKRLYLVSIDNLNYDAEIHVLHSGNETSILEAWKEYTEE